MRTVVGIVLLALASLSAAAEPRFVALDVVLDAAEPVAAWQFELSDRNQTMTVVGVENGDSPAFDDAPYYDRDAVADGSADRIIVADFSLDADRLPSGRIRIATIHVMLEGGKPDFALTLINATTRDGRRIDATVALQTTKERT